MTEDPFVDDEGEGLTSTSTKGGRTMTRSGHPSVCVRVCAYTCGCARRYRRTVGPQEREGRKREVGGSGVRYRGRPVGGRGRSEREGRGRGMKVLDSETQSAPTGILLLGPTGLIVLAGQGYYHPPSTPSPTIETSDVN